MTVKVQRKTGTAAHLTSSLFSSALHAQRLVSTREASTSSVYKRTPTPAPFETSEHIRVVDDVGSALRQQTKIQGVPVSFGKLSALPDFIRTPSALLDLAKNSSDLFKQVVAALDHSDSIRAADWDRMTGGKYLQLKEDNADHFAPGASASGRNNKNSFNRFFREAITNASPDNVYRDVAAGWSLHYLGDAFSSGHLFNKVEFMEKFKNNMKNETARNAFFSNLAQSVWNAPDAKALRDYEISGVNFVKRLLGAKSVNGPIDSAAALRNLFADIYLAEPDKLANFIVCALHDSLNEKGVEVENGIGKRWKAYGDGYLDKSPQTKASMQEATRMVLSELERGKKRLPPKFTAEDIWKHVPRPTAAGARFIAAEAEKLADPANSDLIALLNKRIIDYMPVGIADMEKSGFIRRRGADAQSARETTGSR